MSIRSLLAGIPKSEPRPSPPSDNVVHLPRLEVTERFKRIRVLDQQLMDTAIEIDRLAMKFNSIRAELMRERAEVIEDLKHENVIAEYAHVPPEVAMMDKGT